MQRKGMIYQQRSQVSVPVIYRNFLHQKGIVGEEALNRFLFPKLKDLPKPEKMKNLTAAARLIADYVREEKRIVVWGDYDVDGTTGTALLVTFFREFGINVQYHIPDRLKEGYGLNSEWLLEHCSLEFGNDFLIITVDCGISNPEQVALIQKMGGRVIVTDHHTLPAQSLPDCLILNPSQNDCGFHEDQLAGVGVAFYLAWGLRKKLSEHAQFSKVAAEINLKKFLAFVALGTIADVVKLTTTNRLLVKAGLEALINPEFTGVRELLNSCDILGFSITSEDIGYLLGPRINAAGRLGKSRLVVDLLKAVDPKKAKRLAKELSVLNDSRRVISESNLESALSNVDRVLIESKRSLITAGNYHLGVAGIVASKLTDIFQVPTIVFAEKTGMDGSRIFSGSARSVDGINIVEILRKCEKWIEKFGGHAMAAGLTVTDRNFTEFTANFYRLAQQSMAERVVRKKSSFDIASSVEKVMSRESLEFLQLMEPFGPDNNQPVFFDEAAQVLDSRVVGRDRGHLQLTLRGKYSNIKAIGFNLANRLNDIQENPTRNLLFTPTMNRYRGTVTWQVRVIDI